MTSTKEAGILKTTGALQVVIGLLLPLLLLDIGYPVPAKAAVLQPAANQDAIAHFSKLGAKFGRLPTNEIFCDLHDTKVQDTDLKRLQEIKGLVALNLGDTQITDAGLVQIAKLADLDDLALHFTKVTDKGLVHLKGLRRLTRLDLSALPVTNAGLEHLSQLTQLKGLYLAGTKITDEGLVHLIALKQLTELDLLFTDITPAGISKLEKSLAGCKITKPNAIKTFSKLMDEGLALQKQGMLEKAMATFSEVIKAYPKHEAIWVAYNNRGRLSLQTSFTAFDAGKAEVAIGKVKQAIADFSAVMASRPNDAIAMLNRAQGYTNLSLFLQKENQETRNLQRLAVADYSKSIGINPDRLEAFTARGVAFVYLKEFNKAIEDYSHVIAKDPKNSSAYFNRGLTYREMTLFKKAVADFSKVIELIPNHSNAYEFRGLAYKELKEDAKAKQDLERAKQLQSQKQNE